MQHFLIYTPFGLMKLWEAVETILVKCELSEEADSGLNVLLRGNKTKASLKCEKISFVIEVKKDLDPPPPPPKSLKTWYELALPIQWWLMDVPHTKENPHKYWSAYFSFLPSQSIFVGFVCPALSTDVRLDSSRALTLKLVNAAVPQFI